MKIVIENFGGMVPIVSDRLLPPNMAVYAENLKLDSGELESTRALLTSVTYTGKQRVYRVENPAGSVGETQAFLTFDNATVSVAAAPIVNDSYRRFFFIDGTAGPAKYNTFARILAGSAAYLLGIPAPVGDGSVAASGGVSVLDPATRSYCYTFVSAYGEEGQPSDPITVTGKVDDTYHLTSLDAAPTSASSRNIVSIRIYRTVLSSAGVTTFRPLVTLNIGTTSYNDTILDETIAGLDPLASADWAVPPSDLAGLVAMPNGFFVGWVGNNLYFSEPYRPWAWPAAYGLAVDADILGVVPLGRSAIVATRSNTYIMSGTHPANVAIQKFDTVNPCASAASLCAGPEGVYYASRNGIVLATPSGLDVITKNLIDKVEWLGSTFNPYTMKLVRYQNKLLCFFTSPTGCFVLDAFDPRVAFTWMTGATNIVSAWTDAYTGDVLVMNSSGVASYWDHPAGSKATWLWRSKVFDTPMQVNFSAAKIMGTGAVTFKLICDGATVFNQAITVNTIIRLPSGYKGTAFQIELTGSTGTAASFKMATSVKELMDG